MRILVGNTSIRHDFHAILCKFHNTPLRLPFVLCACLAIATRHPHDQSECHTTTLDFCFILPIRIKRGAPAWIFHMDSAPDDNKLEMCYSCKYEEASISTLSQLNSDKYIKCVPY